LPGINGTAGKQFYYTVGLTLPILYKEAEEAKKAVRKQMQASAEDQKHTEPK
jgi:hypothetical protein